MDPAEVIPNQCTANTHRGERCKQVCVEGSAVCRFHGGGTPLAKSALKKKLMAQADEAIDALHWALQNGDAPAVIRAAFGILDRAGMGPTSTVKVENVESDLRELTDDELEARLEQAKRLIAQKKENERRMTNATQDDASSVVH